MHLSKKTIYILVSLSFFIIFNIICDSNVFAGKLLISSGQTYTISQNTEYEQVTINGTLYINNNNLTITANNLTINSGGSITYTNNYKASNSMILTVIVNNDALINGSINFAGKKGNNGRDGTGGHLL